MTKIALEKPAYGSPCNSCGACCREALCPIGMKLFGGINGPCAALVEHPDGRATCGVIEAPARYARVRTAIHGGGAMSRAARCLLGAGRGCDARFNDEVVDEAFRQRFLTKRGEYSDWDYKVSARMWGFEP